MGTFEEEVYGVAFHPSSFHLVAGFTSKLCFINVTDKELTCYKEVPLKSCRIIEFAHGGQMVAVATGNTTHVFNFYTGECPSNFIFKGQETTITDICWAPDDMEFYTANWSGTIRKYKINGKTSEVICTLKGTSIISIAEVIGKERLLYATTVDKKIREYKEKTATAVMDSGVNLGSLVMTKNQQYVIAGVQEKDKPGSLRVYLYPFNGEFVEVEAHAAEVKKIRISYNGNYLFSAGADGTLFVFELKKAFKGENARIANSNDILYNRKLLEDKHKQIEYLNIDNKEKTDDDERNFDRQKKAKESEIKKLKEELNKQIKLYDDYMATFEEEKDATIQSYNDRMQELMNNYDQIKRDEKFQYKEKMKEEQGKMQELEKEIKAQIDTHNKIMEEAQRQHIEQIKNLEKEHKKKLESIREDKINLERIMSFNEQKYLEKRTNIEDEMSKKLDKGSIKNYKEMLHVIKDKQKAKSVLVDTMKKKNEKEKKVTNLVKEKELKGEELKSLQNAIQTLKLDKQTIEKDIEDRDETIRQKKIRVEELKKKEQELEKFKFVLDYKMRELKGEIEPKKQEIEKLHEQEFKMDEEVKHFTKANQDMHLIVYELLARQQGMTTELEKQKLQEQQDNQFKLEFSEDMGELFKVLIDSKQLKKKVLEYHKKYLNVDKQKIAGQTESQEMHTMKRKYFEDKIQALNAKKYAETMHHANDNAKLMKENEKLLLQHNELLKELHARKISSQKSTRRIATVATARGERKKETALQLARIDEMKQELKEIEAENARLKTARLPILPPL